MADYLDIMKKLRNNRTIMSIFGGLLGGGAGYLVRDDIKLFF